MDPEILEIKKRKYYQQDLPFDFPEEKPVELKLPYFATPRNDNETLLNFQYEYRHGDQKALGRMYRLCVQIAMRYISEISKKNRKLRKLSAFDKESKAHDAASYIIEQLIKRPTFVISRSVTAYLWLRVEQELFYHRKVDKIVDFVDFSLFFKEGTIEEEIDE